MHQPFTPPFLTAAWAVFAQIVEPRRATQHSLRGCLRRSGPFTSALSYSAWLRLPCTTPTNHRLGRLRADSPATAAQHPLRAGLRHSPPSTSVSPSPVRYRSRVP